VGEEDQAVVTQGTGADMGDHAGCAIYVFRLPIGI
jgi:hypothetical protein